MTTTPKGTSKQPTVGRQQRNRFSKEKITTLLVHHTFRNIQSLSLHNYDVKFPSTALYVGREHTKTNLSDVPKNSQQKRKATFEKWSSPAFRSSEHRQRNEVNVIYHPSLQLVPLFRGMRERSSERVGISATKFKTTRIIAVVMTGFKLGPELKRNFKNVSAESRLPSYLPVRVLDVRHETLLLVFQEDSVQFFFYICTLKSLHYLLLTTND